MWRITMSYSEEFIDFIATIKGEAGICGDISKRAVAHCISFVA